MSNMSQVLFCGRKNINLFCLSSEKHHFYSELCRFFFGRIFGIISIYNDILLFKETKKGAIKHQVL